MHIEKRTTMPQSTPFKVFLVTKSFKEDPYSLYMCIRTLHWNYVAFIFFENLKSRIVSVQSAYVAARAVVQIFSMPKIIFNQHCAMQFQNIYTCSTVLIHMRCAFIIRIKNFSIFFIFSNETFAVVQNKSINHF